MRQVQGQITPYAVGLLNLHLDLVAVQRVGNQCKQRMGPGACPLPVHADDLVLRQEAGLCCNAACLADHGTGLRHPDHEHDPEGQHGKNQVKNGPGGDDGDALTHRLAVE